MKNNSFTIRIESILGGQSAYENFAGAEQFKSSYGIDPDESISNNLISASGYIAPTTMLEFGTLASEPRWIIPNPKDAFAYVYDSLGSVYTSDIGPTLTGLSDLNDGGIARGNGAAYYDNYIYFARATTIARYGPLNGSPSFTDDYWVTTLGKTALSNTTYPQIGLGNYTIPNHVLYRHKGRLYITDVVGNQGVLHYIQTTKTTVEGDTDNGSTYNAVDFPYGFWPTAIAGYGDALAVALYEGSNDTTIRQTVAKLAFWDTVNPNTYDSITETEFPDPIITALKNSNGVLYAFSGEPNTGYGVRITRFVGGLSFEQVAYLDYAGLPLAGAVDAILNKIVFGSNTTEPLTGGCVFAIGSKKSPVSNNIFNILSYSGATVTALKYAWQNGANDVSPLIGGSALTLGTKKNGTVHNAVFRTGTFRIGRPFKLTKIRTLLATNIANSTSVIPQVYTDEQNVVTTLNAINLANYPNTTKNVIHKPDGLTGNHSFFLEYLWGGPANKTILALPITIEGEFLED